ISQFHELTNLSNMGINAIELNANELNFYDENGNFHKLMAKVSWDNNKQTEGVDVLFHQRANTINLQQNFNQLIDNMVGFSRVLEILCHSSKLPQKGMTHDTTFRF
ncbi:hypothetical protein AB7Z84_23525, partial [Escherichia coli]